MKLKNSIINQIAANIKKKFKVEQIILFGSYAWGNPTEHSDIDLAVILDQDGFAKSYWERIDRAGAVGMAIGDIRKKIPIDLLVYTKDEWKRILEFEPSFSMEINQRGIRI